VLHVAFGRGVHCPQTFDVGQFESGEDYLVMSRARGDSNPRQLITSEKYANARARIIGQLAEDLARIHQILPDNVAAAPNMRGPAPGEDPLAYYRREAEAMFRVFLLNPHPAIEWAFRWLDRRIEQLPEPQRAPCVVHGDFRIGNVMYDEEGLTALLDWEGTHIGEPEEDIAWLCTRVWRFGKNDREAGGIASRGEWGRGQADGGGASGRPRRLHARPRRERPRPLGALPVPGRGELHRHHQARAGARRRIHAGRVAGPRPAIGRGEHARGPGGSRDAAE